MEPAGPHGREGENSNKTHRLGHQRSCGSRRDASRSEPQCVVRRGFLRPWV